MAISAKIIAHSNSWLDIPLVTFVLEYPRYIHAELMTHRVFSKNSASSRAIPYERMKDNILNNPVQPHWTLNQRGMQGKDVNDSRIKRMANSQWAEALAHTITYTDELHLLGIHKQNVNRLLEPWMHIKIILTGTDFDNWFALRDHKDAQPEIQELAKAMRIAMDSSKPRYLEPGMWHIPFVESPFPVPEGMDMMDTVLKTSTARCARISYNNVDGTNSNIEGDLSLFSKLIESEPRHLSPTEHQGRVPTQGEITGGDFDCYWTIAPDGPKWIRGKYFSNLTGWVQYRKVLESEYNG